MSLSPGARLGPYEILSTIGSGGMGEVYRCRDTRVPRTIVALKTLLPTVAEDADFRRRFTREAQIIARLEHPHICALYDVGDEEGTAYIVMPMLEGQPLADRLHGDPIPIAEALRIAVAVASALSYAHERGVLHRDVKPRNIMLGLDGSVKLVDFGVARTSRAAFDETTESATTLGGIIGTLEYMSPEQLAGRPIDPRSDIFSLGVVVYEMVAGRHPFRADTRTLTACAILDCNYPHIFPGDPLLDAIDAVLSKAMAHDPAERFDTMAEFLNDLEMLQQASTPKAPEPSPVWNYRTPAVAFAVIVAIAALVILFGSLINSLNREPDSVARESAPIPSALVGARPRGGEGSSAIPNYRRVTAPLSGPVSGAVGELGVTVWRLRQSTAADPVRLLVHETGAAAEQWTPERVELGTPLALGDRVRISIESPRAGYLYVIDRERYADGSIGVPHVIFRRRRRAAATTGLLAGVSSIFLHRRIGLRTSHCVAAARIRPRKFSH
jgi:serine/threonine protein kinase